MRGGSGGQQSRLELLAERDAAAVRLEAVHADIDDARAQLQDRQNELDVARYDSRESLRELRTSENLTLREVSGRARVSLGYLSEIERGQKEASSELLAAICGALDLPLSLVLDDVSHRLAAYESVALLPLVPVAAA